jgi:hypothetical protein
MRMAGPVVVSNNYIHDCGLISGSSGKFESDASFMAGFGA